MNPDLRRAAFGDRPGADVWAAVADGSPVERWLAGVVLGGQGHYAAAATVFRELITGPDPVPAALAGTALASHRRQLGGHAAARRLDAAAANRLACLDPKQATEPDGIDLAGAWSDALLGLTADAVGLGRVDEARRLLVRARRWADTSWRAAVRTGWVSAEVELAAGAPDRAVGPAEHAARVAREVGAVRHITKSGLVLSAALAAGGTPLGRRRARELLERTLNGSLGWGIFSLAWPAALMLADLVPEREDQLTKIAGDALTRVFVRADGAMRRLATLSPWVPTALVRPNEPTRTGVGSTS